MPVNATMRGDRITDWEIECHEWNWNAKSLLTEVNVMKGKNNPHEND